MAPIPARCITNLERALARAGYDADFRAHVVEDGRAAQAEYCLSDAAWHVLFVEVERIECALERDPDAATEVDHGEYDAAGVKG
jgi:hypothetical protein